MLNKKIFVVILLVSITISFLFGVSVGVFKIPPYSILDLVFDIIIDKNDNPIILLANPTFNISSIIDIENENDIIEKRKKLISYIYKDNSFNLKTPTKIEQNIYDEKYSDLKNLNSIDEFLIEMEYGVNSKSYLFLPKVETQSLVVYHQGHAGDFYHGKETIQFLLNNNFAVLAFSMPLTGQNSNPIIDLENFGKFRLNYHDDLIYLESKNFSPLKFFFEPISSSLNYLDDNYSFNHYYMMGISGGGWVTGVYSAIDTRIEKSFPVAGTTPIFLRLNNPTNFGDYEQRVPNFYSIANYLEQYVMSSYGKDREQLQIFNNHDPCCFSGNSSLVYEDKIQNILSLLGDGKFSIHIDENNYQHSISQDSLELILEKLS